MTVVSGWADWCFRCIRKGGGSLLPACLPVLILGRWRAPLGLLGKGTVAAVRGEQESVSITSGAHHKYQRTTLPRQWPGMVCP